MRVPWKSYVHPGGDLILGVVLALPGDGVAQHRPVDVGAPEQADGLDHLGGDPPGVAVLVDLKAGGGEHVGGVLEAQVAHDIPVQRLGEGVLHPLPLREADHLGLLGDHVHQHIGGQALAPVGEPLDQVGVGDGGHPHGTALVVDLGGLGVGVLKLADHVAEGAHLPVPQEVGGVLVQGGDLVEGDLADVLGELPVLHGEQVPVGPRPEDGQGDDLADDDHRQHDHQQDAHGETLLLDEVEVVLHPALGKAALPLALKAGGHQGAQQVDHAQHEHKAVELPGLGVDGGDGHIEFVSPLDKGDGMVELGPGLLP